MIHLNPRRRHMLKVIRVLIHRCHDGIPSNLNKVTKELEIANEKLDHSRVNGGGGGGTEGKRSDDL
jgi:hypothetical protein